MRTTDQNSITDPVNDQSRSMYLDDDDDFDEDMDGGLDDFDKFDDLDIDNEDDY